ncbi:MAG: 4a-hydroxytetrahydrobiopterin dehydratase [Candidatus Pacebacteria bacterium]|nr:4a-hydroxytetrahydrobiopterin dehydratase [Candidatus Paceibacterota bacterium]MCF7862884.1 4a-hydroxytetrahydrobiopterin dehydratase [Candidatus Paceibacterota bacterium]
MSKSDLIKKKCVPCKDKSIKALSGKDLEDYMEEAFGWGIDVDLKKISKEFVFKDFIGAINFVERVADLAEEEGHHPDIHVYYNKVVIELWTHSVGGLTENDFILAVKIDAYR